MATAATIHHDNWQEAQPQAGPARSAYLEAIGDTQVTATYLKVSLLVLAVALLASMLATVLAVAHYRNVKPLVVRIDSVGNAQAVQYDATKYHPQEKEMRYFLAQWTQLYYGRNRYTVRDDFPKAFYFMDAKLSDNVINQAQQSKTIETFLGDPNIPNTYIEVNQITLDHLDSAPYTALINFTAKQIDPSSTQVVSQQKYTATVLFTFRPDVPNNMVPVNPLGFTITSFHDQQAFN